MSYWPKSLHVIWRRTRQTAYAHSRYADAKRARQKLVAELATINASASRRLEEGLAETRTRHRRGVCAELGTRVTTTNLIERVMARVEANTPASVAGGPRCWRPTHGAYTRAANCAAGAIVDASRRVPNMPSQR